MMIQTNSGKLVEIEEIDGNNSRLPKTDNYSQTAKAYHSKDRPPRHKLDKVYFISNICKRLDKRGLQLVNITPYKGNRYIGYNYYEIFSLSEGTVFEGYLHEIGKWMDSQGW